MQKKNHCFQKVQNCYIRNILPSHVKNILFEQQFFFLVVINIKTNLENIKETRNNIIRFWQRYEEETFKMDTLIYSYLDLSKDDVTIESYDDRIELLFVNRPDNQTNDKIDELSKELGMNFKKYSDYKLAIM